MLNESGTQKVKRLFRNHKILKDFPCLWGICQHWILSQVEFSVTTIKIADDSFDFSLGHLLTYHFPCSATRLWLFYRNFNEQILIPVAHSELKPFWCGIAEIHNAKHVTHTLVYPESTPKACINALYEDVDHYQKNLPHAVVIYRIPSGLDFVKTMIEHFKAPS